MENTFPGDAKTHAPQPANCGNSSSLAGIGLVCFDPTQPYRHFSHERIAYKYLTWAWRMDDEARNGLTRQQVARYYLIRPGIGHDLTRIALDPKHPRKLASEAELLALRPELNHIE